MTCGLPKEPKHQHTRHTTVTTRLRNAATSVAITFAVACCGIGTFGSSGPSEPPSTLVIRWSQADHRELTENTAAHPSLRTHLVDTSQERDQVLADLPATISERDRTLVEGTDLEAKVIVLGVYGKCTETSHPHPRRQGAPLRGGT